MAGSVRTNGDRIVALRLASGRSQERLADDCRLTANTVRKAEHGGPVALDVVNALAEVFEVPLPTLLAAAGDPAAGDDWAAVLAGKWAGRIEQADGPGGEPFVGEVRAEFVWIGADTQALYAFSYGGTTYDCVGPVTRLFERYFRLDVADAAHSLFTTVYFQITPAGDRLTGRYVGLGPHSNLVVCGEVTATRM